MGRHTKEKKLVQIWRRAAAKAGVSSQKAQHFTRQIGPK
jgi:hypothetical protein